MFLLISTIEPNVAMTDGNNHSVVVSLVLKTFTYMQENMKYMTKITMAYRIFKNFSTYGISFDWGSTLISSIVTIGGIDCFKCNSSLFCYVQLYVIDILTICPWIAWLPWCINMWSRKSQAWSQFHASITILIVPIKITIEFLILETF